MNQQDIYRLSIAAQHAGIALLELDAGGVSLRLRMGEPGAAPPAHGNASEDLVSARSPGVGIFRVAHPTTGHMPVAEGQTVARGQIVGFVQAGSVLRPVTAPRAGVLGPALAADGSVVGYGAVLFAVAGGASSNRDGAP